MKRFIVCLFLTIIASAALAEQAIFSPDGGVLCDRKSGFCADSEGVSMAYTEQFLGKKAAQKLLKIMGSDSDMSSFTMSNGTLRDTREKLHRQQDQQQARPGRQHHAVWQKIR